MAPGFGLERKSGGLVAGLDEVGRGPLAGPVVAAAAVLNEAAAPPGLDDSKKLTAREREILCRQLRTAALFGIGAASVAEIDSLNILAASLLAMRRALDSLVWRMGRLPDLALVDGNQSPRLPCRTELVIKGDGRSASIAAASIIAKVARDRAMAALARECPGYGWETNAGYGTAQHRAALIRLGPTVHHRRSFAPVAAVCERTEELALSI